VCLSAASLTLVHRTHVGSATPMVALSCIRITDTTEKKQKSPHPHPPYPRRRTRADARPVPLAVGVRVRTGGQERVRVCACACVSVAYITVHLNFLVLAFLLSPPGAASRLCRRISRTRS
jgi:hypothetical protein